MLILRIFLPKHAESYLMLLLLWVKTMRIIMRGIRFLGGYEKITKNYYILGLFCHYRAVLSKLLSYS